MKTTIKTFVCVVATSIVLLACGDKENSTGLPTMNSRVVSYRLLSEGGGIWERDSLVTDREILKSWFPSVFNDERSESECNYFALYFMRGGMSITGYEFLSQDMILYDITCTWRNPPGVTTASFFSRAMLICDDKDWKLKEGINLDYDSRQLIEDPNWECLSGESGPDWEKIYF